VRGPFGADVFGEVGAFEAASSGAFAHAGGSGSGGDGGAYGERGG